MGRFAKWQKFFSKKNTFLRPDRGLPQRWRPPTMRRMGETLLDVKGLSCPLPVLRANKVLRGMAAGEKLRVLATDRAAVADFRAYCQETGHSLLSFAEEAGVFSFTIRRRAEAAANMASGRTP
jgi:tRNA 2-thiouridine synthesizing protein A